MLLVGPAGSGKTSCYRVLSKALSSLSGQCKHQSLDGTEAAHVGDFSEVQSISSESLHSQVHKCVSACSWLTSVVCMQCSSLQ